METQREEIKKNCSNSADVLCWQLTYKETSFSMLLFGNNPLSESLSAAG